MIQVTVNLSQATADEIEAFYALSGVGRALDALAHEGRRAGVSLSLQVPAIELPLLLPQQDSLH